MTSIDKCEALKNECIICDTTTLSEVVNLVRDNLSNENDTCGGKNIKNRKKT
jgi:hypothetical protein